MTRVLVVDDDPTTRKILRRMLSERYEVHAFPDGEQAFRHLVEEGADIVLTDLRMPRMDGFELLRRAREVAPELIVFVVTGHSSIDSAVAAMKEGAYDYVAKPFDPDDVTLRIERALKERRLESRVRGLEQERERERSRWQPISRHPKMQALMQLARKVARTDSTVLIEGETGVGKELVARTIHGWSQRREQAFVAVNCSALGEGVLESELFGHEKGAFTGARERRAGYFELAHGGTLLLDEIGTTGTNFQVKLLRVLQDRRVYRVGGTAEVPVDVRIIASTNQDLKPESGDGTFRPDLYYRLSVVSLRIPPLRERIEDVPLLAGHFVEKYRHINPRVQGIAPEGLDLLMGYGYPGNVRELENIVERAMILESGERLGPESLMVGDAASGDGPVAPPARAEGPLRLEEAEKQLILQALERSDGRKMKAAALLGINKTTLWRKMKRYGLSAD